MPEPSPTMARAKAKPQHVQPEDGSQRAPEPEPSASPAPSATKGVTKTAAAKAALDEGIEGPQEAVAFIKTRFGIEMNPQHFSAVKSQLKKKEGSSTSKAKPGQKPMVAPSQAVEGYLAPPPKQPTTGGSDLLDAMEAMKPLVASLGKEQVKRIVDLLG